jgi:hypothetical protein
MQTLPLGSLYVVLKSFANDSAAGRLDGYVISATALAVSAILQDYEAAVDAIQGIADVVALSTSYGEAFHALVRVTHHKHELPVFLLLVQQLLSSLDLPLSIRSTIGEHVATTVLFCVAHFAAHGIVLEGRRNDFFIQTASRRRRVRRQEIATEEDQLFESDSNSDGDEADLASTADADGSSKRHSPSSSNRFVANKRLIPCGLQLELVNTMIQAGNTRHVLKKQLRRYGVTRLRSGEDDDATAKAIFASIYNAALTSGGRLVVEELAVRVEAARSIWSKALWDLVGGGTRHLENTVRLLRDAFLGHRGDLWGTFVEKAFPLLTNVPFLAHASAGNRSSSHSLLIGGSGVGVATSTKGFAVLVDRAYQSALREVRLDDTALAHSVSLSMDIPAPVAPATIQEAAEVMSSRIRMIFLTVDLSAGTELVISKHTLDRYHCLFCFQLEIRFALHSLHSSRKQLQELVLGPFAATPGSSRSASLTSNAVGGAAAPSAAASWKHAMSRIGVLLHFYTFVLSTVGQYFQVDVIEGHYSPLVALLAAGNAPDDDKWTRQQRRGTSTTSAPRLGAQSVEEARIAHERALLEVSDAMFYFDSREDGDDEHDGGLVETLECASQTAFALFCLVRRCAAVAVNLGEFSSSGRGGGDDVFRPLTSEVLTSISFLERSRNELIIGIASHLSKSSNPNERSLWARLDFNKFISTAWHNILRGGGANSRNTSSSAAPNTTGVPLSLGSLAASHRSSSSSNGLPVTTKLQSVSLSRSGSTLPTGDPSSSQHDDVQLTSRADF